MKKFLVLFVAIFGSLNLVFAEPILELTAPRQTTPKVISDDTSAPKAQATTGTKSTSKTQSAKKYRKPIYKKPAPIKVDYERVSRLIEYGYYEDADSILERAMNRNSKDIKAQALWTVSLAKQCKLDPAQKELNTLLKKYPENSDLHYAQGIVYYKRTTSSNMFYRNNTQNLLSDALKEFKKAIALDKTNAKAYNAAGVVSLNMYDDKSAKDYFQKAVNLDKTYSVALDNSGTIDYVNGNFSEAEKKFKQALQYNTQNTTAMYHLAQISMQKKDYATALKYLNDALAINENSPAIYNLMGRAYKAQGNEAAAINAFKKSLAVKPEFTLSYLDLADIYEKRDDAEFAIEQLETALSINPNYSDAKLKMADISLSSGKYNKAIRVYSELVGIDNYNEAALKGLANAYYGQAQVCSNKSLGSNKELLKALDNMNKAISANNKDLELHLAKLKITKITNQPDLSKVELQKIIQTPGDDLMTMVIKGEAYLILNDYQNSQKSFDSAIKLSKNTDDDLYLSEIFIYHKQYKSAEKILQKVLQANPQNQEALSSMDYIQKSKKYANNYFKSAQFYLKSKNLSAATEYLSRSLAIEPNNAQARLLLAELSEKQKDYKNALENYKAYLGLAPNASDAKKIQKKIKKMENQL